MARVQREGKVKHLGLSEATIEQIERARTFFDVASVQNRFNLVDREWEGVLDYCQTENIAFIPWFPLLVGKVVEAGDLVAEIARRHDATPGQIALAWLLGRSGVMLPIPGTSRVKHLEENVAAADVELSLEEVDQLSTYNHSAKIR
jgi:aryl-alcohol dehydrogenase-like predicted oxidoreductase